MPATTAITSYPWQPDSTATGDLAIKNLREGLKTALKNERGIHIETLLTAVAHLMPSLATGCRNGRMSGRRAKVTSSARRCRASIGICEQPGRRGRTRKMAHPNG